ncbi:hypothetical protein RI367_001008 [Sorochytrium milnesiophthora]
MALARDKEDGVPLSQASSSSLGSFAELAPLPQSCVVYRQCADCLAALVRERGGKSSCQLASDQSTLDYVYRIVKYMPHIDALLLSTNFLVYNNDLIEHLSLVKVLVFFLTLAEFDVSRLLSDEERDSASVRAANKDIMSVLDCLQRFAVKLHAAYARIRIEHQATGATVEAHFGKLVDWSRETSAEMAPKTFRVRGVRAKVLSKLKQLGISSDGDTPDVVVKSSTYDALLVVLGTPLVKTILESDLASSEHVVLQDQPSLFVPRYLRHIGAAGSVLDVNANMGLRALAISDYLPHTPIIAVDSRWAKTGVPSRLRHPDITTISTGFLELNASDAAGVSTIILEPENTLSAVYDNWLYMLQEQEIPPEKPLEALVRSQKEQLRRALSFPGVERVIYVVRSECHEETVDVVSTALEHFSEFDLAELPSTFDDVEEPPESNEAAHNEMWPCLMLQGGNSEDAINGIFVAVFERLPEHSQRQDAQEADVEPVDFDAAADDEQPDAAAEAPAEQDTATAKRKKKRGPKRIRQRRSTLAALRALSLPSISAMPPPTIEQQREWDSLAVTGMSMSGLNESFEAMDVSSASDTMPRRTFRRASKKGGGSSTTTVPWK